MHRKSRSGTWWGAGLALAGVGLLALLAGAAGAASDACEPCRDPVHSQPLYQVPVSRAGRDLLVIAVGRHDAYARMRMLADCAWDSLASTPGYRFRTHSVDSLRAWHAALEGFAAMGAVQGDSANALGMGLLAALERAERNPQRTPISARGQLVREAGGARLTLCDRNLVIVGPGADSLASAGGTAAWLQGYCHGPDTLEWVGGHALGVPRLDLFVMGLCPYARRLEAQMSEDLAKLEPARRPLISVHYLLYWDDDAPGQVASLHGPKERTEDAVQILLRDEHAQSFWPYLALRSHSDEAWEVLAQRAGLSWQAIGALRARVEKETDAMLVREHLKTTADFPHADGSPTILWQGEAVRDIGKVPGFSAPKSGTEKCSN